MPKVIAITGGIGAGKSVVSNILRFEGFEVYDCDAEAKRLMDESVEIHQMLCSDIHPHAVVDGCIDRKLVSSIVFTDVEKLTKLNEMVHSSVRSDISRWIADRAGVTALFIETAILYQSRLYSMVDMVVEVIAPKELRIQRVMQRNNMTRDEIEKRIESQNVAIDEQKKIKTINITNDGFTPILPQIKQLLGAS